MEFVIPEHADRVFILGAGASVDYGLPVWKDLGARMKEKIEADATNSYKHKEKILKWIDKVGEKKAYETLDECIYHESSSIDYHTDGVEVENELFAVMLEVFNNSYGGAKDGWIRKLNEKILMSPNFQPEKKWFS